MESKVPSATVANPMPFLGPRISKLAASRVTAIVIPNVGILSFCQFVPSLMSTVPFEVSVASTKPCQWRSRYGAGHA